MAFELHRGGYPGIVASAVTPRSAVIVVGGDTQRSFGPALDNTVEPHGIIDQVVASGLPGESITVYEPGDVVKVTAAASLGSGTDVGVASGGFSPISGASGITRWRSGKSHTAAAAGETFSVYVSPRQLSNLI